MSADDVHPVDVYAQMIGSGELKAWWKLENGEIIGWCALYPNHNKYAPDAWHLYGVWIREDFRRRGLAEEMWNFRIGQVPAGVPVTVSVQPGKVGSEALLRKFGFEFVVHDAPWNEYCLRR